MSDISVYEGMAPIGRLKGIGQAIVRTAIPYSLIYAIAFICLIMSYVVGFLTGKSPILGLMMINAFALTFFGASCVLLIYKLLRMIFIEKPDSPTKALYHWTLNSITRDDRPLNFLHMWLALNIFMSGFASMKDAIPLLNPFSWDQTFTEWDRVLHLGKLPFEWLAPLLQIDWVVFGLNFFYNVWFFIMLGSLLVCAANASKNIRHRRYLVSFFLTWLIGGALFATAFSSAGPCFYEKLDFGTTYVPLMAALNDANQNYTIWALNVQDILWDSYTGTLKMSAGISAFPSMHVATTVLIALYAGSVNKTLKLIGWSYVVIIFIGSVALGWHYAVDGYAGGLIALAVWKLVPKLPTMGEASSAGNNS